MDIEAKCSQVMRRNGWTQRELATALGISETTLSNVLKGRRSLPVHAFVKLERMRGIDDKSIVDELIRAAASVAAVVILFSPGGSEGPRTAPDSDTRSAQITDYNDTEETTENAYADSSCSKPCRSFLHQPVISMIRIPFA